MPPLVMARGEGVGARLFGWSENMESRKTVGYIEVKERPFSRYVNYMLCIIMEAAGTRPLRAACGFPSKGPPLCGTSILLASSCLSVQGLRPDRIEA